MQALTLPGLGNGPATWQVRRRSDPTANALVDRHYSRRASSIGSGRVAGPGRALVLVTADESATWVTHWPEHALDGLDAWRCSVFRNEGPTRSSDLIRSAMAATAYLWRAWAPPPRWLGHLGRHRRGLHRGPRLLLPSRRLAPRPHLRPRPPAAHPHPPTRPGTCNR